MFLPLFFLVMNCLRLVEEGRASVEDRRTAEKGKKHSPRGHRWLGIFILFLGG